jgi:hypothetical protein
MSILNGVEAGVAKLDRGDIWTANSSPWSLLLVSIFLFWMSMLGLLIGLYYFIKMRTYWRWKFRKIL